MPHQLLHLAAADIAPSDGTICYCRGRLGPPWSCGDRTGRRQTQEWAVSAYVLRAFPSRCRLAGGHRLPHNLMRTIAVIIWWHHGGVPATTLRARVIAIPARFAHRAWRLILHLSANWKWTEAFTSSGPPPWEPPGLGSSTRLSSPFRVRNA